MTENIGQYLKESGDTSRNTSRLASRMHRRHIDCLKRVRKHVDVSEVALTGGCAIDLQLGRFGFLRRSVGEDIDFVAKSLDAVPPSFISDFLVAHYHLSQPKFLVMLVDPISRIRVDIFPDLVGSMETAEELDIEDCRVKVLGAAVMFAHKVLILETSASQESSEVWLSKRDMPFGAAV